MRAKEELLARINAMTPEQRSQASARLITAIFAPDPELEDEEVMSEIDNMTNEEVTAYLVKEGFDIEEMHRKLNEMLARVRKQLDDNYDPTPFCIGCGAMASANCHCGPIAENE